MRDKSSAEGYPGAVTLDYRHERRCERVLSTVQLSESAECTWSTHSSLTMPTRDTAAVRDETITAEVRFERDLESFSSPVGFLSAREYIVRGQSGPTRMLYFAPGLGLIVREHVVGAANPALLLVARREPSVSEGEVRLRLE